MEVNSKEIFLKHQIVKYIISIIRIMRVWHYRQEVSEETADKVVFENINGRQ